MPFLEFAILIGVVISLLLIYKYADRYIKRMDPKTIKVVNWIGFGVAIIAGVGWYFYPHGLLMLATLLGVVVYFLFFGYDQVRENE